MESVVYLLKGNGRSNSIKIREIELEALYGVVLMHRTPCCAPYHSRGSYPVHHTLTKINSTHLWNFTSVLTLPIYHAFTEITRKG